eukprot:scaffold343_cov245-Pinguiococcus_pyrenoidosus.AAC.31
MRGRGRCRSGRRRSHPRRGTGSDPPFATPADAASPWRHQAFGLKSAGVAVVPPTLGSFGPSTSALARSRMGHEATPPSSSRLRMRLKLPSCDGQKLTTSGRLSFGISIPFSGVTKKLATRWKRNRIGTMQSLWSFARTSLRPWTAALPKRTTL